MSPADRNEPGYAEARYKHLERVRQPYLDEARRCAALTIPSVCPPTTYRRTRTALRKPNQGLGARGVENLAGKFVNVLLPPGMPFFKVGLTPKVLRDLEENGELYSSVTQGLSKYETDVVEAIEQDGDRTGVTAGFVHLPITGNVLLHELPDGGVRHFGLDQYVVTWRPDGQFTEIILQECTPWYGLEDAHKEQLGPPPGGGRGTDDEVVDVYTRIYLEGTRVCSYQEAKGIILEDTEGEWPMSACPWLPLGWLWVTGEDYARGLIELHYNDLKRYDELSKLLGDGAKNAAKLIWMINGGGGQALVSKLSKAESGDFVVGDRDAIKALQQEKANDLQVAAAEHSKIKQDLSLIFLLGTAIQRGGDRVTKFEVEYLARELESAYAVEYTMVGRDFQVPYFNSKTAQLIRRGRISRLPKEALKVQITTGIDALGRGSDQMRLESLAEIAVKAGQIPESMMNPREFIRRSAANLNVKPEGLIPSEEEVQQQRAQAQQQALLQQVAPEVTRGISQGALQQQAANIAATQSPEGGPIQP